MATLPDADSFFVEIDHPLPVRIHYKDTGIVDDDRPVLLLLHGFAASVFSWHKVMQPLAVYGRVIAYDRLAFGFSDRPLAWEGEESPYSMTSQIQVLIAFLDRLNIDQVIIMGHSQGGLVAFETALLHPNRVKALIGTAPAIFSSANIPGFVKYMLSTRVVSWFSTFMLRKGISLAKRGLSTAWHDPTKLDEKTIEGYTRPLSVENWDRALWEFTLASVGSSVPDRLGEIQIPVAIITGDDDRIIPTKQAETVHKELSNSQFYLITECGHLPHEEQPDDFLKAVASFFEVLPT